MEEEINYCRMTAKAIKEDTKNEMFSIKDTGVIYKRKSESKGTFVFLNEQLATLLVLL